MKAWRQGGNQQQFRRDIEAASGRPVPPGVRVGRMLKAQGTMKAAPSALFFSLCVHAGVIASA